MNIKVVVGLAAGLGAVVAYAWRKIRAANVAYAHIKVRQDQGKCVCTTTPFTVRARRGGLIDWDVDDPQNCLGEADLEFRFPRDDSPLADRRPKAKRSGSGRRVQQNVRFSAQRGRVYDFSIWYVTPTQEYEMEDPEIQIEY